MNERIRELAEQAGLGVIHNGIVLTKNVNAAEAFENFAQLIVAECADFVREYPEKYLTHNQANEIGFGMEEHFGVEE